MSPDTRYISEEPSDLRHCHFMPTEHTARNSRIPSLRSIYVMLCIFVLLLPVCGALFFRIYENALIRQTERELIAQAAVIATKYRTALKRSVPDTQHYGLPLPKDYSRHVIDGFYTPVYPQLDLNRHRPLPQRPTPEETPQYADPYASVAGNTMTPLLQDVQRTLLSGLMVLDHRGIIVAGSGIGLSLAHAEEIQAALRGEYTSVLRHRDIGNEPDGLARFARSVGLRVFAAYPVIHNRHVWGVVYLSHTPPNILKQLDAHRDALLFIGIGILAITGLAIGYIAYTVIRPIRQLTRQLRAATEAGDIQAITPLEHPGCRELDALSRQLGTLAGMLHERTEYIRIFASHVSHEFDAPLTEIRGAADTLVEHLDDAPPEQKRRLLHTITQDTQRLQSLTTRLQELAEADNLIPASGAICYIMPILMRLQDRYQAEGMEVAIEGDCHCDAMIKADHFESIIDKLLENARQHSATKVQLMLTLDEQTLTIRIRDNGEGINKAEREKIFRPFFTTRREKGGTGLGLGIVRALVIAYGGTITVEPVKEGASFVLVLPANQ